MTAEIEDAQVHMSGAVALTAQDNSVIQSIAGALGVGVQGSGFGVGLSWNQVALNVDAEINNASVNAASVGLTSEST